MMLGLISRSYNMGMFLGFIFIGCFSLIVIGILELLWIQCDVPEMPLLTPTSNQPVFSIYGRDVDSGYLHHVYEIFDTFGFRRDPVEKQTWDVLWAHEYPFIKLADKLKSLKPYQKINHFPGTGFITNKLDLAVSDMKYIPKAFRMPHQADQLSSFAMKHPNKLFVQKSNNHRGIRIKNFKSLDFKANNTFIQEYVSNPLLVDGYKFDIGIYTIITSVEPLRVYIYNGDTLFRFCPEKYFPIDHNNINKYVITDDYLPIWKVPSLKRYMIDYHFTMKESFNAYMKLNGRDPIIIWNNIEDAIRTVCLRKESSILKILKKYPSKRNFFEMMRFDFAVDDDLNVFIMEANMSPNLSSAHFPANKLLYQQVLFSLFSLVGLSQYHRKNKLEEMEVSIKNIMVYAELCSDKKCNSCFSPICQLCYSCLSNDTIRYLKESYVEHYRRRDCKRIFPPTFMNRSETESLIEDYNPENRLLYNWFKGKCIMDSSWCS